MKKTFFSKKTLSIIVCIVLIAAIALGASLWFGSRNALPEGTNTAASADAGITVLGQGQTVFSLKVVDDKGIETAFEIHTDKKTVGEALLELELIAGEDSAYGLYVKTVNGTTVDYDADGKYWAFYIDGEYAMTGVDSTDVVEGAEYSFKVE